MNSAVRRQELIGFLKSHSIFKVLDKRILEGIGPIFQEIDCGPGHIVFRQGDSADAMYVIREGAVEVIQAEGEAQPRTIAYLTAGECFGEMAIIHETQRSATIRVPEEASIVRFPKAALKQLQAKFPEITGALAEVINKRLSGTLPFLPPGLQGNLAFFDLPTVIQTVVATRQSGALLLFGPSGKGVAQLIMKSGSIRRATFQHLTGERALYELLSRDEPLDFLFERQDVSGKLEDSDLCGRLPHMLLIEGARRSDELPRLLLSIAWPEATYLQSTRLPDWTTLGAEKKNIAPRLWLLMEVGCTVQEMSQKLPYDRYTLAATIEEMLKRGYITRNEKAPPGQRLPAKTAQLPRPTLAPPVPQPKLRQQPEPLKLGQSPSPVVSAVNALNAVTLNLGRILGNNEVRFVLSQALARAAEEYRHLASLRVNPEIPTLDLRGASAEFSQSESNVKALEFLARTFIEMAARTHKTEQ